MGSCSSDHPVSRERSEFDMKYSLGDIVSDHDARTFKGKSASVKWLRPGTQVLVRVRTSVAGSSEMYCLGLIDDRVGTTKARLVQMGRERPIGVSSANIFEIKSENADLLRPKVADRLRRVNQKFQESLAQEEEAVKAEKPAKLGKRKKKVSMAPTKKVRVGSGRSSTTTEILAIESVYEHLKDMGVLSKHQSRHRAKFLKRMWLKPHALALEYRRYPDPDLRIQLEINKERLSLILEEKYQGDKDRLADLLDRSSPTEEEAADLAALHEFYLIYTEFNRRGL